MRSREFLGSKHAQYKILCFFNVSLGRETISGIDPGRHVMWRPEFSTWNGRDRDCLPLLFVLYKEQQLLLQIF